MYLEEHAYIDHVTGTGAYLVFKGKTHQTSNLRVERYLPEIDNNLVIYL